ncbi:MAG: hypothetical protein ACQGVC_18125 [Myxococcota bacterium]
MTATLAPRSDALPLYAFEPERTQAAPLWDDRIDWSEASDSDLVAMIDFWEGWTR